MKHAGMQPYFFPYIGYFNLLNRVDIWIFYDVSQFSRKWMARNRVLKPEHGWQYINVPVKKHSLATPLNQIKIANEIEWQEKIFSKLHIYKGIAPFYKEVIRFLEKCFSDSKNNLAKFNIKTVRMTCDLLGITTPTHIFSEMNLPVESGKTPEDTIIQICQAMGVQELISAPGGVDLYNEEHFSAHGIKLTFQPFTNMVYECGKFDYEPALSIIDVLMWNSREDIKMYLDRMRDLNDGFPPVNGEEAS